MKFKKYSCSCGCFTDSDEVKCPLCGRNSLAGEIIFLEELLSMVEKGEVKLNQIRTKHYSLFYETMSSRKVPAKAPT